MTTANRSLWPRLLWVCVISSPSPVSAQSTAASPPIGLPPATLSSLFSETVRDVRHLPSQESLTWLGIGAAVATLAHPADRRVTDVVTARPSLDKLFEPGEMIGGARLQLAGAAATYTLGRLTRSPKVSRVGADLIRAQLLSQVLTAGVKMSVRRGRPDGTNFSFPSGHTSVTFASATVLQRHFGWKAGVPAYAVATYVAASRINEKRHFLSDVAFGAAVGIVAGRTVTIGRGNGRFAVTPRPTAGGAGVSVNWLGHH